MLNQHEHPAPSVQPPHAARVDVAALKRAHPITEVVTRYGLELRPIGRALVGYCPFHEDRRKPNFHIYPDTDSWYCYRCRAGGDAIDFVERLERVDFLAAVDRLTRGWRGAALPRPAAGNGASTRPPAVVCPRKSERPVGRHDRPLDAAEQACLSAAIELYANRLLGDAEALAYVGGRGLSLAIVERYRLGYAAGSELLDFLRWRRLSREVAQRVGLLGRDGHEFFAGRIVVPELRGGQPVWAVGRRIQTQADCPKDCPKYLCLPGRKPLLGWEDACRASPGGLERSAGPARSAGSTGAQGSGTVYVTEGVFDWLVLCAWGLPALSLVGTHASREHLAALERFSRVYLVLDNDEAGRTATGDLALALGARALPVWLPDLPGVKDVADLALHPDGRRLFACALAAAQRAQHPAGPNALPKSPGACNQDGGSAQAAEGAAAVDTTDTAGSVRQWPTAA